MIRPRSPLAPDVLQWLACLPFLGVDDLALLTGQPEPDIELVLREMKQDGLADSITPSSPELGNTAVHVLSEHSRRWLSSTLGEPDTRALPLARRDVVHRVARLEATVALNVFAAGLVASLRRSADHDVADFRALPVRRPQDAWWPPGVLGYGCIRAANGAAPFFVTVDRAGTPAAHRAALIAAWHRFRESSQPWGHDIPPILVMCPGPAREDDWSRKVLASAMRRDVVPLRLLSTSFLAGTDDVGGAAFRQAHRSTRAELLEWLPVRQPEHLCLPSTPRVDVLPPASDKRERPLHLWANDVTTGTCAATTIEQAAAIALTTSTVAKSLIQCLGHHPLLNEEELATLLHFDRRAVRRVIERAATAGLIVGMERPGDDYHRYCLGSVGLNALAVRDGVAVRRYKRHALVTVHPAGNRERMPTLLQQYEHTTGANSIFIAWLRSPEGGSNLLTWLSAAEAAIGFENGGRWRWLRPDGAGSLVLGDRTFPFLLEWDRGTERVAVLARKFARYAEYYQTCRKSDETVPTLLFVTTTPQREQLVWHLAAGLLESFASCLRTTSVSLLHRLGPSSVIWHPGAGQARVPWPSQPSHTPATSIASSGVTNE